MSPRVAVTACRGDVGTVRGSSLRSGNEVLGRGQSQPGLLAGQPVLGSVGGQRVLASQPHRPVAIAAAAALLDDGSCPMAPDLFFEAAASLFVHSRSRGASLRDLFLATPFLHTWFLDCL